MRNPDNDFATDRVPKLLQTEDSIEIAIDESKATPQKNAFIQMRAIIENNIRQIQNNAVLLTEHTSKYEIAVSQSSNRQIMSDIHGVIENHRCITSKICALITTEKQRISKSYHTDLPAMMDLLKSFQESLEYFQLAVRILNESIREKQNRQIHFLSHDDNAEEDSVSQHERDTLNGFTTLQREEWIAAQIAFSTGTTDGRPLQFNAEIANIERAMKEIQSLHDHLNVFAEEMQQKQRQNVVALFNSADSTAAVSDEARKCKYWLLVWIVLALILVLAGVINHVS